MSNKSLLIINLLMVALLGQGLIPNLVAINLSPEVCFTLLKWNYTILFNLNLNLSYHIRVLKPQLS